MRIECRHVSDWLKALQDRTHQPMITGALAAHVTGCAVCRRQLEHFIRLLAGAAPTAIDCAEAEDQLPVLVDLELSDGSFAAANLLPDVWWHRFNCRECLTHYQLLSGSARLPVQPYNGQQPPVDNSSSDPRRAR